MQLRTMSVTELDGFTHVPTLYRNAILRVHRVLSAPYECCLFITIIFNRISSGLVLHHHTSDLAPIQQVELKNGRNSSDILPPAHRA
jgi:hypothetical protein